MTVASQVKQTLAGMKGVQGTLRVYSAQTRDEESRKAFNEALTVTKEVIIDLEDRISELEFEEPQYKK